MKAWDEKVIALKVAKQLAGEPTQAPEIQVFRQRRVSQLLQELGDMAIARHERSMKRKSKNR